MAKHGIKGSFYLNASRKDFADEFIAKLMVGGCDIGGHSQTHPWLPGMNPNEIFYELLTNRVQREAEADRPIITLAFPSGAWKDGNDPQAQKTITEAFLRTGFTNTPYRDFATANPDLGPTEVSTTHQVVPGDHVVDPAKFDQQMQQVLASPPTTDAQTRCISLGVHGRQTGTELEKLDGILEKYAANPDWWYCTMNEYGAYYQQFHHTTIEALPAEGATRRYRITRPVAGELGADVPLTVRLNTTSVKSIKADGFEIDQHPAAQAMLLNLHHSPSHLGPSKIDLIDNPDNATASPVASKDFPNLRAWLVYDPAQAQLKLTLQNQGAQPVVNLAVTLRLPPLFEQGVMRLPAITLDAKQTREIITPLGPQRSEDFYHACRAYFVAEIDLRQQDANGRLHVTTRLPATPPTAGEIVLRDAAALLGPFAEGDISTDNLKNFPNPGDALPSLGDTPTRRWFSANDDDRNLYHSQRLVLFRKDRDWATG